jgi:hypothetical protein
VRSLALAAAVFVLAGCGSDSDRLSKDSYERQMQAVLVPLNRELTTTSTAIRDARSRTAAARDLTRLEHTLDQAAARLDRMRPPQNAAPAHRQVIDGLRGYAKIVGEGKAALRDRDPEALREFQGKLGDSAAARRLRRALGRLHDLGYDVGV